MGQTTIPRPDAAFNESQQVIVTKSTANAAVWNLDNDWLTKVLTPAKNKWDSAWAACQNPATRTPLITFEKNEARKVYEPLLRTLVRNLEYNTKITDEERREMGIVARSTSRTPIAVPTTYPDFTVDTATIRRLTINFRDRNSERRAKPAGVSGAVIRWALLDKVPTEVAELTQLALDTASPYTMEFAEADRGRRVYICLAWQNTRGERGPWSEIATAIVP